MKETKKKTTGHKKSEKKQSKSFKCQSGVYQQSLVENICGKRYIYTCEKHNLPHLFFYLQFIFPAIGLRSDSGLLKGVVLLQLFFVVFF